MLRTSRRQFARVISTVTAALPLVATDLVARALVGQTSAAPPPAQPKTPEAPPKADEKPSALGKALTEVVRAEYGKYLSDDEIAKIGTDFNASAQALQRLRDFKLTNGDEPDFTFASLTQRW